MPYALLAYFCTYPVTSVRCALQVMVRNFTALMALPPGPASGDLPLDPLTDPRLALTAATLGVSLGGGGRTDVTITSLAVVGHVQGPGRGPGAAEGGGYGLCWV